MKDPHVLVLHAAAARIPVTLRDRFPSVPWPDIVAFRNLIVHEYFFSGPN